jgi:hypothetical protein
MKDLIIGSRELAILHTILMSVREGNLTKENLYTWTKQYGARLKITDEEIDSVLNSSVLSIVEKEFKNV